MKKILIKLFAVTILMQLSVAAQAYADESVRVTANSEIVDADGNITAIQNHDDPRNNDYEKYYMNVDADGKATGTTSFYVVTDPDKGYVRKEIPIVTAADTPQDPPVFDFSSLQPATTPGQTTSTPTATVGATAAAAPATTTTLTHRGITNAGQRNLETRQKALFSTTTIHNQPGMVSTSAAQNQNAASNAARVQSQAPAQAAAHTTVDAPQRNSSSDAVYGNVNNAQTLYDGH